MLVFVPLLSLISLSVTVKHNWLVGVPVQVGSGNENHCPWGRWPTLVCFGGCRQKVGLQFELDISLTGCITCDKLLFWVWNCLYLCYWMFLLLLNKILCLNICVSFPILGFVMELSVYSACFWLTVFTNDNSCRL